MKKDPATPRKDAKPARAATPTGAEVIAGYLAGLPESPGVYRMIGPDGNVLYVGKAKNLRKRVTTYRRPGRLDPRVARMVTETASMEFITTHTEAEALLLEANLIKKLKPHYNILLRDDKSFPYILITGDSDWPRIMKYRGARKEAGEYFGPFASAGAVNQTLAALERAFPLRSCSDSIFASRTRPCLQYQIKRCSAPCVGRIAHEDYASIVDEARDFLAGRSRRVQESLDEKMRAASERLEYEKAAVYRDRIQAMTQIQSRQDIAVEGLDEADVIAVHQAGNTSCIQVFFFRAGQNLGNRSYFPSQTKDAEAGQVLAAFLGQFYDNKPPPKHVLLSHRIPDAGLMAEALSLKAGHKVTVTRPERGAKRKLLDHALVNAREALGRRLAESATQRKLLEGVAEAFGLESAPERIEVYDNSHVSGTNAVGAMIVAGAGGFLKNAYRKFTVRTAASGEISPGDDYGMMREILGRRFARALKEDPERGGANWPDLLLIDGGAGHLNVALETLADLGLGELAVVAIAKGPNRNAGRERFFQAGRGSFMLEPRDPVLYFLQRLRDEAHRFAIGTHRSKRSKTIAQSTLDAIPGIGGKRKRALLHHFGSARSVAGAGLEDLEKVEGISRTVAKKIYDHFHGGR
ncbi:MAG: excinuclease ABC subunit UvrC [Alphaproteobacteria bacterium]